MTFFVGTMASMAIYIAMNWKLADWSFGLVHLIPDNALTWIGLQDMSMSEERVHDEVYAGAVSSSKHGSETAKPQREDPTSKKLDMILEKVGGGGAGGS